MAARLVGVPARLPDGDCGCPTGVKGRAPAPLAALEEEARGRRGEPVGVDMRFIACSASRGCSFGPMGSNGRGCSTGACFALQAST